MAGRQLLLILALLLAACAEKPSPPPSPPPPEAPAPTPEAPTPLHQAPIAQASLGFSARCDGEAKRGEIEAESLKIGMVPTAVPPALANQLIDKTRIWHTESQGFDFYKVLALRPGKPAQGCIRYQMSDHAGPYAEITLLVSYDPKLPEVINIAPTRMIYRDLEHHTALKVALGLRTFSLDRTAGRQSNSLQNQEILVDIFGPGPIDQRYDPAGAAAAVTVALPPWDYAESSTAPKRNLSFLAITVTEIADFDWLQSQILTLWPGYEYEATDVAKLKLGALHYGKARRSAE